MYRIYYLVPALICCGYTASSQATELYAQFNSSALFGAKHSSVDLSKFSIANYIPPGDYLAQIVINGKNAGSHNITFNPDEKQSVLCIDTNLLQTLDLKEDISKKLSESNCLNLQEISSQASYQFNQADQVLEITLPQALLHERPAGYINPKLFDAGVTSAYLKYDYNRYQSQYASQARNTSQYLSLAGGINLKQWNYRHRGSFTSHGNSLNNYNSSFNVLSTDLVGLKSRLSLGEFSSDTRHLDSASIVGVQLASDVSMQPSSMRSFAPVIRGVAESNAKVSIYQAGQLIDERSVPPGAFEISTLSANRSGNLTVEITEADGSQRQLIIPNHSNANLLRPGMYNYTAAVGRYRLYERTAKETVAQFELEYGINNYLTGFFGVQNSSDYRSLEFGVSINTPVGALEYSIENSDYSAINSKKNGYKSNLGYNYHYLPTNTSFYFNRYDYSKNYISLNSALAISNSKYLVESELAFFKRESNLKSQNQLSINQSFDNARWGSVGVSLVSAEYWGKEKPYRQYNASYNNSFRKLNYSVNISNTKQGQQDDRYINLNFSMPLDFNSQSIYWSSYINHSDTYQKQTSISSSLSGSFGDQNQTSASVNSSRLLANQGNSYSSSANISHQFNAARVSASYTDGKDSTQNSVSLSGAVVAHPFGVTLANELSDTYTIIHAKDASGAAVESGWGTKIDRFGNAIYSNAMPYQENAIALNPASLADNINLADNQKVTIPRRYSSTLLTYDAVKNSQLVLNIVNSTLRFPMGSKVTDANDNTIGFISQSTEIFIENTDIPNTLYVTADNDQLCTLNIPHATIDAALAASSFYIANMECSQ